MIHLNIETNETKRLCEYCGGILVKVEAFPNRPGYELRSFACTECDRHSKIELDTRFIY